MAIIQNDVAKFLVLKNGETNLENMWYQEDGATAQTARGTMAICSRLFVGRLRSKNGDMAYPAKFPDLFTYGVISKIWFLQSIPPKLWKH